MDRALFDKGDDPPARVEEGARVRLSEHRGVQAPKVLGRAEVGERVTESDVTTDEVGEGLEGQLARARGVFARQR